METARPRVDYTRRRFLAVGAVGMGALAATVLSDPARAAAASTPVPKLPGEYWRREGLVTRYAGTVFDDIAIRVNGDAARLFVPRTLTSGSKATVVWLYHGAGSDHNAIIGGFVTTAERTVDEGAIAICQNAGGTLYSHPTAQQLQVAGHAQLAGFFDIRANVLRPTSAGGALAAETYAADLIPNIAGLYSVNAVYDLEALYADDPRARQSLLNEFGSLDAVRAANPARHPTSAWQAKRVRVVVSQPEESDTTVPPSKHGLALQATAAPVATEASVRTHTGGHATPKWADDDFIEAGRRWVPAADATPPTVSIATPKMGAVVGGWVTVTGVAADDTGVTEVRLTIDGKDVGPATYSGGQWRATVNSAAFTNDKHVLRAVATDAAGNSTISAWVAVRFANNAPVVAVTSPASGATVSGVITLAANAASPAGISRVAFSSGARAIGDGVLQDGLWRMSLNTRTSATPNGTYPLVATATDRNGVQTTSEAVTIIVRN